MWIERLFVCVGNPTLSRQQNGRKRRFTNHQRTSITREVYPKPNPSLLFENDDDSADVSPTPSMTAAANDEPCAFAKLWGQLDGVPFHSYMTSLPSTLGRGSTATEGPRKPPGFIDLGRSKALSREHGENRWWALVTRMIVKATTIVAFSGVRSFGNTSGTSPK